MDLKTQIQEAKQAFGEKAAHIIAEDLHIDKWDSKALKGCCPFHNEETPSFMWNKKGNYFKCFGCGINFGILDHYQHQGLSYAKAIGKLAHEADVTIDKFEFKDNSKDDFFKNYIYPKEEKNTSRDKVEAYLKLRGISKATLDFADIKEDYQGNIVFEHRDTEGILLASKYRVSRALRKKEDKMWWQKKVNMCPILYGVDKIDITMPLLITEGHIDRLACIEAGFTNVVSIPIGASDLNWIEFNWEWLENFDIITLWSDNDEAGKRMIKESLPRLGEYRCKIVEPTQDIVSSVRKYYSQYNVDIGKTDPNNVLLACGKQEVLKLINSAKEIEDSEIKDLMSFKYFSIQDRETFSTGLEALDRIIHGHLLKCLTLYTGYTGAGKTTTINQIALRAFLESNEKVFVFSGEMGGDKLMSWLLDSLAGQNHIIEWNNGENRPKGYSVTSEATEAMQKFYMGNIQYYDKRGVVTARSLFEKMEYCRRKYGIKHFFIDNLMCLMTKGDEDDKWQSQIDFIIELSNFVENKNVGVHLVAHPKKPSGQAIQSIYDVAGVSELVNACNRAFWVKKIEEPDKDHQSEIIVLKDRETGSSGTAKLQYDKKTRRLFSNPKEQMLKCRWEENINIKYPELIRQKLVANRTDEREVTG